MTEEQKSQRDAAIELLRAGWVRWNHQPEGKPMMVTLVTKDGMIELLGWSGQFAPHLFVAAPEPLSAKTKAS